MYLNRDISCGVRKLQEVEVLIAERDRSIADLKSNVRTLESFKHVLNHR